MRILNIIQCTNLGGMEQANLQRLEGLRAAGHEVAVLSLTPLGPGAPLLTARGFPVQGLPYRGRGGWRTMPELWRALRRAPADALIMTGHNLAASLALAPVNGSGRRLLAIHFHHTGVKPAWQWRMIYRAAVDRFQAITFPTDFVRREAEALCPEVAALAHTVRDPLVMPAVPTPEERSAARAALALPADAPVIGNAGWLIARKRFDVFIRTAARITAERPDAVFPIAGDGPERARLEELARGLGVARNLHWLGWRDDLTAFYRALDVLLFNSDWDALGRTPLEALGHGVPVVASVVQGGLPELLDRPDQVPLFRSHETAAMADAVLDILREPEAARRRVLAARARVADACCARRHAAVTADLLGLEC